MKTIRIIDFISGLVASYYLSKILFKLNENIFVSLNTWINTLNEFLIF